MKIGQKIRKIRQLRGMQQKDAAGLLGIDPSRISKMENDKEDISMEMLEQLANVYGVEPADILTFDDKIIINVQKHTGGTSSGLTINTMSEKMQDLYEARIKGLEERVALQKQETAFLREEITFLRSLHTKKDE